MRQRLALRRILLQRLFRLQTTRPFTSNTTPLASRGRPQLPFLSIPVASSRYPRVRYFTTEKKRWLRYEGRLFLRYNVSIWGAALCALAIVFLLNQEALEKEHPTPHEWSLLTRVGVRGAKHAAKDSQGHDVDWVEVLVSCREMLKRLEDPAGDGAGIRELLDEPLSIEGVGAAGKDLSAKSENWRRGYYELLMLLAQASEQLDGWVRDKKSKYVFPPEVVIGPSNPRPRPIPPGAQSAPVEEDCEPACEPADNHYLRILTTRGFTDRQKMDAALRYASFLDYKNLPDAAERMYQWALSLATEEGTAPSGSPPQVDPRTYTLVNDKLSPPPSENLLTVLTSIALHKARAGDVSAALPIFVSVLRARRALPQTPPADQERPSDARPATLWQRVWDLARPPRYPRQRLDVVERLPRHTVCQGMESRLNGTRPPIDPGISRVALGLDAGGAVLTLIAQGEFSTPRSTVPAPPSWPPPPAELSPVCLHVFNPVHRRRILLRRPRDGRGAVRTAREGPSRWDGADAVDLAEEQLRAIGPSGGDGEARRTCRECLSTGLQNWSTMVARLAREEEEEKKAKAKAGPVKSAFGFWSEAKTAADDGDEGRWVAEEKVVKERVRRTRELLVQAERPASGLASLLQV
ncbi:uncharacterized protein GLRG_07827 [Colletotrichum graminicola M1.001]|uniref:MFS maltose permease n=1 Tax=Colletotrichum graminicola (strain M1.001 / M2 / FGSC 10212) TaxID=645133 RepID=E3QP95_COLGM|nr:uncharacterized protein GLRG_07827 [Colletotrichum graminicola M1.001]EFQ32683.1 hypothetical protein GLRG_07827 [Colletotrichum graminicola M1.001]